MLAILWARADILRFFEDNGCTTQDTKPIRMFEEEKIARARMVDLVFDTLSARADEGLGQFRAMLQSLVNWSHFDSYYFDKIKKLDRATADRHLTHLRQLQEIRDAKLKKDQSRINDEEARRKAATTTLTEVRTRFLALFGTVLSAQKRGYALEEVLQDLSKLAALETTEPFRCHGEQIDGALKYDGEHCVLEAKWHDQAASNEPLYQFVGKVEGKMYGRGIFVSINGFSPEVVKSLVVGKAIKTILVDGGDVTLVVEGLLTLAQMVDRKVKAAQTKGLIYVDPITGAAK
jgi:hypothetical protein